MPGNALEIASLSHQGMMRGFNEDSLAIDAGAGLAVLADGMGGHHAGDVASQTATRLIAEELPKRVAHFNRHRGRIDDDPPASLAVRKVVGQANSAIRHMARSSTQYRGMGTTIALALFCDDAVTLAHVGDSRVYRVRRDRLQLLTRDDSLLREQVELGIIAADEARNSNNRSIVTRALGVGEEVPVRVREEAVEPGDIFLLCSDGLNDMVDDRDIELVLVSLKANLPLAAHHLVQAANDNGGLDNISVILVKVLRPFPAATRTAWVGRFLRLFR